MKSNKDYDKEIDNGLKKQKLKQKYGANFSEDSKLSPELEGEWLNNIEDFEKQFAQQKTTTVYNYIGQPDYKKIEALEESHINKELENIIDIFHNHNIVLDTLCEVENTEIYRFITEELFNYEMDDMRIEGMNTCFIYEDFHPNAKYDIEQAYDYFFRMTMGKSKNIGGDGYDLLYIDTDQYLDANGNTLAKDFIENRINNFLRSFDYFEIINNEIINLEINIDKTNAIIKSHIHYRGCFEKSSESIDFKGEGQFKLKPSEYGGWNMYHICLPGLNI